jgi:hypothetical protein
VAARENASEQMKTGKNGDQDVQLLFLVNLWAQVRSHRFSKTAV